MTESAEHSFDGKPAPYPKTSLPEIDSRDIFHRLLNRQFVKGDINVSDKVPNWDGILELTDDDNYPIGKVEVQLKTLRPEYAGHPKFQCKKSFFGYCSNSILPVLLVVVDRQNGKAYWRHMNAATLSEVKQNITGESFLLPIPEENCLDGHDEGYVVEWTKIAKEAAHKVWNFDSEAKQKKELEEKLKELHGKLQNPVNLPDYALREIHEFLDEYNYILDKEFGSVKRIIYPDYWKIGMGVIKYDFSEISFFLYPVEYNKPQLLIKEADPAFDPFGREMSEGSVLLWAGLHDRENFTRNRIPYCYGLLESRVMGIAGKYNFPLADLFLANEYLISFIDKYNEYLDWEKHQETYSLRDLKYMLYGVVPMLAATTLNFADWVTDYEHDIDHYERYRSGKRHREQIADAKRKIDQGFQPKVAVTTISRKYNIELIHYYIGLLEAKRFSVAKRQYKILHREQMMSGPPWKTWSKQVLWLNVQEFFPRFYRLYDQYIGVHFPNIRDHLRIVDSKDLTLVHVLHFDENRVTPPHMEVFHLRPEVPEKGRILTFLAEDPDNPIDRKRYGIERKFDCKIDGKGYQIILFRIQLLDFFLTDSPSYSLINENLTDRLGQFFREKKN